MVEITDGEGNKFEQPLIMNDPTLVQKMRDLADKIEKIYGPGRKLVGLSADQDGNWILNLK